jgi:sugar phosphate isomerase/epimerase
MTHDLGLDRRTFIAAAAGATILPTMAVSSTIQQVPVADQPPSNPISIAEWSLHRAIFADELTNLDFPIVTRQVYGLSGCEYVSIFFKGREREPAYLADLVQRSRDAGVRNLLIMVDREGALGDADGAKRRIAVLNHVKWLEAATALGCHSIRVNAASSGTYEEQQKRSADGLSQLSQLAQPYGLNVIVENHGGLSSNGAWLAGVMELVAQPNCGTLPDFGNFRLQGDEWYDRYKGVAELMPYARAVSAKSQQFNAEGIEVQTDFSKMMSIVRAAGYNGYIGIEWEGGDPSEKEGILLTKQLLLDNGCTAPSAYPGNVLG